MAHYRRLHSWDSRVHRRSLPHQLHGLSCPIPFMGSSSGNGGVGGMIVYRTPISLSSAAELFIRCFRLNKYLILAFSVVAVALLIVFFSGNPMMEFDQRGIAHGVSESAKGYTFDFDCSDGTKIRCFSKVEVTELGHYGISGAFSSDGSIFFVSTLTLLDDPSFGTV